MSKQNEDAGNVNALLTFHNSLFATFLKKENAYEASIPSDMSPQLTFAIIVQCHVCHIIPGVALAS